MSTPYETYVNNLFCTMFSHQQKRFPPSSQRLVTELSDSQRVQGLEELHGVSSEYPEPNIEQSVKELERELLTIQNKKEAIVPLSLTLPRATITSPRTRSYYKQAMVSSPEYVRGLYLKCLRAKDFDPKQSAELLERFLELKSRLFGQETLTRDIIMSDLSSEDIQYWKTDFIQISKQRDSAGRSVMYFRGKALQEIPTITILRLYFLLSMKCVDNEVDQKRGIVHVVLSYGQTSFSHEKAVHFFAVRDSLPTRSAAVHQCFDNLYLQQFVPAIEAVMSKFDQCRHRFHLGSPMEVKYILMSFGIQKESFPINFDGTPNKEVFERNAEDLFKELKSSNKESSPNYAIPANPKGGELPNSYVPGPNDVIMGRSSQAVNAPGNTKLRVILEACREKYDSAAHRMDKMVLTHHVFSIIKDRGGRFIKHRQDGIKLWEEVPDEAAREKVALGFRNLRRRSSGSGGTKAMMSG